MNQDSKVVTISPKDFIFEPYIQCPKCGKQSFGVLMVRSDSYIRRCAECFFPKGHEQPIVYPLPELRKKIIYIDQLGISNMMKALNPDTKAHQEGRVPTFWLKLFERLDSLVKLQLVLCPDSSFHDWESSLSPFADSLKRMYEHLSYGVSFYDPDTIRRFQIMDQLEIWLGRLEKPRLEVDRIVRGEINAWQERIRISVNSQAWPELIQELRNNRELAEQQLTAVFGRWQREKARSFDDWYEEERQAAKTVLIELYKKHLKTYMTMALGLAEVNPMELLPSWATLTMHDLQDRLGRLGIQQDEAFKKIGEFLNSEAFMAAPYTEISAMLYAGMARKAASGRKRPPGRGFFTDVNIISTLLPYCDAMFVDNECRMLLTESPIPERLRYGTKVFSSATGEEFLAFLNSIEAAASPEHLRAVEEVYGPDWAKPYTEMYQSRR